MLVNIRYIVTTGNIMEIRDKIVDIGLNDIYTESVDVNKIPIHVSSPYGDILWGIIGDTLQVRFYTRQEKLDYYTITIIYANVRNGIPAITYNTRSVTAFKKYVEKRKPGKIPLIATSIDTKVTYSFYDDAIIVTPITEVKPLVMTTELPNIKEITKTYSINISSPTFVCPYVDISKTFEVTIKTSSTATYYKDIIRNYSIQLIQPGVTSIDKEITKTYNISVIYQQAPIGVFNNITDSNGEFATNISCDKFISVSAMNGLATYECVNNLIKIITYDVMTTTDAGNYIIFDSTIQHYHMIKKSSKYFTLVYLRQ